MGNPQRILIVDDNPNTRLMFRAALEWSGYAVAEAADGEAALARLRKSPADLVLLDLKMPGIDGMETLRRLRAGGNAVPVVMVTAHGSIPDAVAALKLGAFDFLTKPVTPEGLRRTVGEVLARHVDSVPDAEPLPTSPGLGHPTAVTIGPAAVDLTPARQALDRREFKRAAELLQQALDLAPDSVEALTLVGVLHEGLGQDHAAYHAYKSALEADPRYGPALANLRRYCERYGLDSHSPAINPGARPPLPRGRTFFF